MYKNQVDKDKKDDKVLKRIINEILLNKIIQKILLKKLLILHGLMILNYLIKLTMTLLIDILKTKIQLNYYIFKTF